MYLFNKNHRSLWFCLDNYEAKTQKQLTHNDKVFSNVLYPLQPCVVLVPMEGLYDDGSQN